MGTINETFTIRNETAGSDAFTIQGNNNNATFTAALGIGGVLPSYAGVKLHTYNNGTDAYNIFESSANKWIFGQAGSTCQVGGLYGTHSGIQVTTAGNVGIGTDSPSYKLEVSASTDNRVKVTGTGNNSAGVFFQVLNGGSQVGTGTVRTDNAGNMSFFTGSTSEAERMRITSGGRVLIGPNSSSYSSNDAITHLTGNSSNYVAYFHAEAIYAGAWRYARFMSSGNSTLAGEINGSNATSVIYGTTSDYRQKKNIKPLENGLERLSKLKPVKFDWKENDSSAEGFIAHEVQEIFPDAIYGKKDGEKPQGMDYGRITPLLVKAIQELTAKVEMLENNCQCKN